jgi:hypothetical protein
MCERNIELVSGRTADDDLLKRRQLTGSTEATETPTATKVNVKPIYYQQQRWPAQSPTSAISAMLRALPHTSVGKARANGVSGNS